MWIFCCGMYRSASTLQFQIATRLVKDAGLGEQIGWIDWKRFPEVRNKSVNHSGLKVCKVHICSEAISSEFYNGCIYIQGYSGCIYFLHETKIKNF